MLRSVDPHIRRIDEHERVGCVDQRGGNGSGAFDLQVVEEPGVAGREERARRVMCRPARIEELQVHRGTGTRNAGNRRVPFDGGASVLHREPGPDELAGVGVVDDDDAFGSGRVHHPFVHHANAKGPMADDMFPQLLLQSICGRSTATWPNV